MPGQQKPVAPFPVPMTYGVTHVKVGDQQENMVAIEFHAPTGTFLTFLSPAGARELARQVDEAAGRAGTSIIVAGAMDEQQLRGGGSRG